MTYRMLDLFSGAGGAARGYANAGFEVVGVDTMHQPRYPYVFLQDDALRVLEELVETGRYRIPRAQRTSEVGVKFFGYLHLADFDAIHASPPCQGYSLMSNCRPGLAETYPKLIEPTRELLEKTGLPYVIENVVGAKDDMRDPITLCGTMFSLWTKEPVPLELQRHRLFETNWPMQRMLACSHVYRTVPVYGHGAPGNRPDLRGLEMESVKRKLMGIDWMTREELNEAIPPAFTEHVGLQLRQYLMSTSNRQAA